MEAPEGPGEGGTERSGSSSQAPPIATTPPCRGWKEELVSQSSSGTHVSNASGISLGEAIRRQSALNRDMEAWYQPYTEADTSDLIAAIRRRFGETRGASGLAEFPATEGGLITPTYESRRQPASNLSHTPLLEAQDSRLSPNLPLLTTYSTQGQTFFSETLFQTLGTEFAPLRGTPDVSSAAHETSRPLQTNEAVPVAAQDVSSDVDCSPLSQHPFTLSTVTPSNASPDSCLSQYPLSCSRHGPMEWRYGRGEQLPSLVVGFDTLASEDRNFQVLGTWTQKLLSQPPVASLPLDVPRGTVSSHDPFLLDSTMPAPVLLEMLEKEVGLSSSGSSSCKSTSGKDPEAKEARWLAKNMVPAQRELGASAVPRRQDGETVPELDPSQPFSDSEGKPFTNASLPRQFPAKASKVALANKGHSRGDSCLVPGMLPRPWLDKQQLLQQVPETVMEEPRRDRASTAAYSRRNTSAPFLPVTVSVDLGDTSCKQVNAAALGTQAGASQEDFTLSGCSIERQHKYTGISPSFTEGSFFGSLAHPINHSTPGIIPARALAQKAPGLAPPVQSPTHPPPSSFHTETSTSSHATTCVPSVEKPRGPSVDDTLPSHVEEPPTLRSEQEAETGTSESLQAPPPLKGRIQSLPSLSFMEKVGVWNTSQTPEKMSDALALQRLSPVSPRQKAYSAVADSLNRILLKQQSQAKRREGPAGSLSASSMTGLHTLDKSLSAFPLTRSRSENSVVAVGQEVSRADAGEEIEQEEDSRPAEAKDAALGAPATKRDDAEAEDLPAQRYTAVLVSTVLSDEETVDSVGGEGDLKRFVTSERVAELLREEAASLSGDREKTRSPRAPPGAHPSSSQLSMDRFSDVSPDSLNQMTSSVASSGVDVRLPPKQPSVLSRDSRTSLGDVAAPPSPVLKTPDDREINIDERIPVYLRNLGIHQSPSSILTPFLPRGPIREIEFSPSELRTMKASTDALEQFFQASEGDSHSVGDVTLSTFDSSTLSVPVLAGSDPDPDTSLPTDLWPKLSRDPLSQGDAECHLGESRAPTPCPPESVSEFPAAPQPAESSQGIPAVPSGPVFPEGRSTKYVQVSVDRFNPKELGVGHGKLPSLSLPEEEGQMSTHEEPNSFHVNSSEEEGGDSFVGSKTLNEIQELLAQAEARSPSRFIPVSPSMALGSSLTRPKKADGCGDFGSVQWSSPGLQRIWSWDETLTRQNVHEDTFLSRTLSFTGSLKWEGTLSGDVLGNDPIVPEELRAVSHEGGPAKSTERSEPEGCNSAAGDRNLPFQPVLFKSATGSGSCSVKGLRPASTAEPPGGVLDISEGFQQVLERAGEMGSKGTGSNHGSGNSSSVDSLGIRVKNVLRGEYPTVHAAQRTEGEDRGGPRQEQVFFSRATASENSSSLDSLAARVRTLLENERPVMHAAQILQRAEEEEKRALMWVKLKLAAESPNSAFDLNEEDRRKIEEIKAELLLSARNAEIQAPLWGNGYEEIPGPFRKPETGHLVVPDDTELRMVTQAQNVHAAAFPVQVRPACGADCFLPRDPQAKPLQSVQSYICTQFQTCTGQPVDFGTRFHAPLGPDGGTCLSAVPGAPEAHAGEEGSPEAEATSAAGSSPTEAAKQITSITFASRKRSPPLPSASPVPPAGLTEAIPHDLVHLGAKSVGDEQLGPSRQLPDALNPSLSASSTATGLHAHAGFSPGGDRQPVSLIVSGDEPPQRKGTVLEDNAQARWVEQKVCFVPENQGAGPFSGGCDEEADPGGKMSDWPPAMKLPQQTTGNYRLPDRFAGSRGSFVRDPSRLRDADSGSSVPFPSPSPDRVSAVTPASPSSPTRKALSGVHITLSPKRPGFDSLSPAAAEAEMRHSDVLKTGPHPVTSSAPSLLLESTSELKPSTLYPETRDSAYFPRTASSPGPSFGPLRSLEMVNAALRRSQEMLASRLGRSVPEQETDGAPGPGGRHREGNFKITVSSQTERLSSDAITQITTEGPEKTTYSAEIFVSTDHRESGAARASDWKGHGILRTAPPARHQASGSDRQAGKPLLLPYKPPGSSEMYYVPCPKEMLRLSRVRSETTVESSHSGSNDAVPPEFPTQALGSRDESPQDAVPVKHREGIYSKRAVPKVAWTEGKAAPQERVPENAQTKNSLEPVQATHSVFRSAQFYLHHPMPLQHEIDFHARSEDLEQSSAAERPVPPSRDFFQYTGMSERSQPPLPLRQPTGKQKFSPLVAELDYSLIQEPTVTETCERDSPRKEAQPSARKAGHQVAKELPLPGSRMGRSKDRQVADLPHLQSVRFTSSLDELWSKYLERRQQQQHPGSRNNELSLVERLDRLARLLQNPVRHLLVPARDEQSNLRETGRSREPKKIRSHGKTQGSKSYPVSHMENSHGTTDSSRLSESRRRLTRGNKPPALGRILEQNLNSENPSETSSEARPGEGPSTLTDISTSESDTVTQEETTPPTEASGSVSSIDTARLIRAFGHDRVHASPRLSQLYSTISRQRSRSEKRAKGSRRAPSADRPRMAQPGHKRKGTQAMYPVSSSDSVSTPGSSRGPSSALSNKRSMRMLNKAVQAGDFEIVNSATRKHTRDVGLTFPTPTPSQVKLQGGRRNGTEAALTRPDGLLSGNKAQQRRQPSGLLAAKGTARDKLKWLQGVSWFVPAEDLKSAPTKETRSGAAPDPGPSWFEPLSRTKPWREPLREKNWPEDPGGLQVRPTAPARDVENAPPPPYAKLSLQEALVLRRPDFVSRSGERVKRLKLIMEERKLQSVLQSEREQLFNPPVERRARRNGLVSSRGYRAIQRARSIPRDEMVQRSKRIYEQLPEVQKRREEEKRKSDSSAYRLKAQLYKAKITNRILGRKVPWE